MVRNCSILETNHSNSTCHRVPFPRHHHLLSARCQTHRRDWKTIGASVCAHFSTDFKTHLVGNNDYISDVSVSSDRNYNSDQLGWYTIPVDLKVFSSKVSPSGLFLSYQRPVQPITRAAVYLGNANGPDIYGACAKHLGDGWRAAGDGGTGYIDHPNSEKTLLCLARFTPTGDAAILADFQAVGADNGCPAGFIKQILAVEVAICFHWQTSSNYTGAFVTDIEIHRADPALGQITDIKNPLLIPGGYTLAIEENLNAPSKLKVPVYLLTRVWRPKSISIPPALTKPPLVASSTGSALTFKILQIADLHITGDTTTRCRDAPTSVSPCSEAVMQDWINKVLDLEKPNFVVFTGDNVQTFKPELRQKAMDAVVRGVELRQIPYSMVFGNHDDENGFSREKVVEMAMNKPFSYTQCGPVNVDGVGNYELSVTAPKDGKWGTKGSDIFRMYSSTRVGIPTRPSTATATRTTTGSSRVRSTSTARSRSSTYS